MGSRAFIFLEKLFGNIQRIKFVEEYRLNDVNYFQLQISILYHHVPEEPAYMLSKYQSVVSFHGMKVSTVSAECNIMLFLTNCEVHTGKYLDRSFEVRTEPSEVRAKN